MLSVHRLALLALAQTGARQGRAILLLLMLMSPATALGSSPTALGDCASIPGNCRTEGCEANERSVPNSCSGDGEACCVYFCPGTCLSEAAGCIYPRERVSGVCANKGEICCSLSGSSTTGGAPTATGAARGGAGAAPSGGSWTGAGSPASTSGSAKSAAETGAASPTEKSSAASTDGAAEGGSGTALDAFTGAVLSRTSGTAGAGCTGDYQSIAGVCFPALTGLSERPVADIIQAFANWLLAIFGFIAILGFVISGLMYLTAAGDEGQAETAKRNMQYSIIGVIVALSGWVVVQFVDSLLKASL